MLAGPRHEGKIPRELASIEKLLERRGAEIHPGQSIGQSGADLPAAFGPAPQRRHGHTRDDGKGAAHAAQPLKIGLDLAGAGGSGEPAAGESEQEGPRRVLEGGPDVLEEGTVETAQIPGCHCLHLLSNVGMAAYGALAVDDHGTGEYVGSF